MTVAVEISESKDTERLLEQLPIELRGTTIKRAVKAAGTIVSRRAKQLAPRSSETETSDHWSADTAAKREGAKPLRETISVVVRNYGLTWVAVVGPQYPAGALAHLVESGHVGVFWGREQVGYVEGEPFMEPAADETLNQQRAAFENTITKAIEKHFAT